MRRRAFDFQGLKPDIVAIQEFQVAAAHRPMTSARWWTRLLDRVQLLLRTQQRHPERHRESLAYPCGRHMDDPFLTDRDFAWARIDLPGPNDLYVVSVHLHGSGGRAIAAQKQILSRTRSRPIFQPTPGWWWEATSTLPSDGRMCRDLKAILSDNPIPTDLTTGAIPIRTSRETGRMIT
jgi:endonuclease/exonuclease/phosphatase family metal-dependent hydrolase